MKLQLRVLGGARAGVTGVFSAEEVTLGRHPTSDLPFHPTDDIDVSARHATIVRRGSRWLVRDLGSANGTLVNGHVIRGDTTIDDTDQIRLGPNGPSVEVRFVADATPDQKPAPPDQAPPGAAAPPVSAPAAGRKAPSTPRPPSTTQRIRLEVGRQTRRLRVLTGALVLLLVGAGGYLVVDRRQREAEQGRERQAMQARVDSIVRAAEGAIAQLRGEVDGLATALRTSQENVQRLQGELRAAEAAGQSAEVTRLRSQLSAAAQALRTQQAAALVDYQSIYDANHRAVALVWAEFTPGDVNTGTAFAVTSNGVMITNRHVLFGEDGTRRAGRVAIKFSNSAQVWRGTVLGASREVDLAVVRVEGIRGEVPAVALPKSDPSVRPGNPVATIGFPFGTDLPMRAAGEEDLARTTLTAGIVSKVLPDQLQIDGYGAQGASGSPVFDRHGQLIGVLYAGESGTSGRIVYLVPVKFVTALLQELRVPFPL